MCRTILVQKSSRAVSLAKLRNPLQNESLSRVLIDIVIIIPDIGRVIDQFNEAFVKEERGATADKDFTALTVSQLVQRVLHLDQFCELLDLRVGQRLGVNDLHQVHVLVQIIV